MEVVAKVSVREIGSFMLMFPWASRSDGQAEITLDGLKEPFFIIIIF